MSIVAIIPARGGSKRIPRKNIRQFCGKPMIAWTIQAAINSKLFDRIIVSTDDPEVADISQTYGAEAPFSRPPELSTDRALTAPVIAHAIKWLEDNASPIRLVCCIYATSPFLQPHFLRQGLELLDTKPDADFTFSIASYSFPIFRALKRNRDGTVGMFWPENEKTRSQDLPEAWHDAGQFYWGHKDAFLNQKGMFTSTSYPVVLPRNYVQDIDTEEDWAVAEKMQHALQANPIDPTMVCSHDQ
jgi:pseudaminic acid cytidylyltransferase